MPTLTLVLDRTPVRVYDLKQPVIRIGRREGLDITIDNPAVSRRQAELREQANGTWTVRDVGSANGTFLNGRRVSEPQAIRAGDELSFGKFSLFFEHLLTESLVAGDVTSGRGLESPTGTHVMTPEDVEQLRRAVEQKRQAQLQWESGGQHGTFSLAGIRNGGILVGRTALCDLYVPEAPGHHLLIKRDDHRFQARNLSWWRRMRVNGTVCRHAVLESGDVIEMGRMRLTFRDQVR
jgi:FHA domain-containing protein